MEPQRGGQLVRGLGLISATALVAGNIIGSGIYTTPGALAEQVGPLSLLAWPIVAVAYLALTKVYTDLSQAYPDTGGFALVPQRAFGPFAGFLGLFLYWVSNVTSNAAFATAFVGYAQVFVPAIGAGPLSQFFVALLFLWILTGANILGVKVGGAIQTLTVVLKVIPLLVLAAAMSGHASDAHLHPFAPHGYGALFPAISLIAWLFLGAESVTVPAEEIKDAGRTIRRAAYWGYALAAVVYLAVGITLTLGFDSSELAGNPSPLAYAAAHSLGPWGEAFVSIGALVSIFGVLNGWLLVTGRLPYSAAVNGVGPAIFGRLHPRFHTPAIALVFSSAVSTLFLLQYFNNNLLTAYNNVSLAATNTGLVAIALSAAAYILLVVRDKQHFTQRQAAFGPLVGLLGLAVVGLLIFGSGSFALILTAVTILVSAPLYFFRSRSVTG